MKFITLSKFFCLCALLGLSTPMGAVNPRSGAALKKLLCKVKEPSAVLKVRSTESDNAVTHYPVILELDAAWAEQTLEELDAVVFHHRGNIYLTSIPIDNLEKIPHYGGVNSFQLNDPMTASLDVARNAAGVDVVHQRLGVTGSGTQGAYSPGKIVTGICDIGFDPSHEVFRDCLKKWVIYDEYHGRREAYDGYENIIHNAPSTDNIEYTHATHVGNILCGYNPDIPYYGVAPFSDFVATTSSLSYVGICSGIEDVIAHGKSAGKPVVVNISAGSYLGPHDGTDLVGRYLAELAKDAVICFSAGNFGQRSNSLSLDLDDYDYTGSAWCGTDWVGFTVDGGTDIWGRDDTPFQVRLCVWDATDKKFVYQTDWIGGDSHPSTDAAQEDGDTHEYYLDLAATPWFTDGGVWMEWGVYEHNNRYAFSFEYDYSTEDIDTAGPWARYAVGFHIRKLYPGTHVDVYSDGIDSFLHGHGMEGALRGTSNGTVSNLASGPDVVCVGGWNSRNKVPLWPDDERTIAHNIDCVTPYSSWGTSGDLRKLPHFCAPGNVLVGALSHPHSMTEGDKGEAEYVAFEHSGNKYFATGGTSMASPFTAGVFALWLSVNPRLDVHDLVEVARQTANRNFADIDDPRWGAGAIDAFAGLEKIEEQMRQEGIEDSFIADDSEPFIHIANGSLTVFWPGVEHPDINVYDISGRPVATEGLPRNTVLIVRVRNPRDGKTVSKIVTG
ncbi:MAG: S8 family serine peptidase [Muribaculaceae bacterium]|nr:S8 family serine peptidase [Muribaculaceae bacterium]